jgi:hypothetical protein
MQYNPKSLHQRGTKAFKDLNFKEQALSINGTIAHLEKAIRHHARAGTNRAAQAERKILEKCTKQVERLADRLRP